MSAILYKEMKIRKSNSKYLFTMLKIHVKDFRLICYSISKLACEIVICLCRKFTRIYFFRYDIENVYKKSLG